MLKPFVAVLIASLLVTSAQAKDNNTKAELDAYWHSLAQTVREGDAAGYRALYHSDAVVVLVEKGKSQTIGAMMKIWKPGFEATAVGQMRANVEDRFSKRIHGENTAWESGIFHYWTIDKTGKRTDHYTWFESLLVKKEGIWLQTMELQRKAASPHEWKALAK